MNTPFQTILVAVDFGEASARALQLAAALAGRTGARLTVLHAEALDAPPYFTQTQMEALEREARATRARAVEFLRAFARRHVDGPFEAVIETRSPTDAILHASAGASLVVMGTHGRRGRRAGGWARSPSACCARRQCRCSSFTRNPPTAPRPTRSGRAC